MNGQLGVQEVEWLLVDEHAGVRVLLEEALVAAEMRLQTLVVGSGHRGRGRWVTLLQQLQALIQVVLKQVQTALVKARQRN